MYKRFFKRLIDLVFSALGLLLLSPLCLILIVIIKTDNPGPAFFKQQRAGLNKKPFYLYKFRSMKMSAPHNIPTHLLKNPKQYITRIGGFLRKYSLDELPQIWNIFCGDMSIIGPRPALLTQTDLLAERDKYGANNVKPGLTGLAQISGRDELSIMVKAELDGRYTAALNAGRLKGFSTDIYCFFTTIFSAIKSDGVIEGGTGTPEQKTADTKELLK